MTRTASLFERCLNPRTVLHPRPRRLSNPWPKSSKITGNEISPGTLINYDGGLWIAVKTQKVKPGKGGAYNQVELKNVTSGTKLNQRFRSDEAVDEAILDKKDFQFLFASGEMLTFMDMETYDQIELAT